MQKTAATPDASMTAGPGRYAVVGSRRGYREAARLITGKKRAEPEKLVTWLQELRQELAIPGLKAYGITRDHFDELIANATHASSMKGNPVELTRYELREILEAAL